MVVRKLRNFFVTLLLILASPAHATNLFLQDIGEFTGITQAQVNFSAIAGASTFCVQVSPAGVLSNTGAACGSGSGTVNSVTNSDGTLTINPTTGAVVASLALGHANTWTAAQSFGNADLVMNGATSGTTTLEATAVAGTTIATFPANTGTVAELNLAQTFTATQTFPANSLTFAELPQIATSTVLGNFSGSTANVAAQSVPSCANDGSHALTNNTGSGFNCVTLTAGTGVTSVSNSDGTLTISPTTGAVVASLALGHANTWTATQTFPANSLTFGELPQVATSTVLGNFSGSTANLAAQSVPSCATDGAHGLTNGSGSGFNCTNLPAGPWMLASVMGAL